MAMKEIQREDAVVGGYECECLPGFERIAEGAGCTDIDECFLSMCHPAASFTPPPVSLTIVHCHVPSLIIAYCLMFSLIAQCRLLSLIIASTHASFQPWYKDVSI
ncbi:hypothetical protein ANCDUO_18106 [Ancylostoma duodenale]|uniref:Uncharacterized protein n=1 Tax=Ancylostoma duodenale TaxID=51022 RepID=A0A0C2G441_9BILA|nr:hypothetical protein ANCDUO_18106 [Ancylostoma duodenale]